jgi:hypothetical protein
MFKGKSCSYFRAFTSRKTRGPYFAALDVQCHPEWSTVVQNAARPESLSEKVTLWL